MSETTYKEAGVNIDAGDAFVDRISPLIKKTKRPEVLGSLGGYAGLFQLDLTKYKQPIIVSTTDGVGTKLKLAFDMNLYGGVGVDLVAMCVNDLICCGAEPLFFLDYYATGKLSLDQASQVIEGITGALEKINCTLIGGETAEMPGMYAPGDFDLAGFAVGAVDKSKIIDGKNIQEGDVVLGVASSGVHSNGFSLVRKILEKNKINPKKDKAGLDRSIGEALLEPTLIYVNPVKELVEKHPGILKGVAHITGGGLQDNTPRVLPDSLAAAIQKSKIKTPQLFKVLQDLGKVPEEEMWRVFNMGVGLAVITASENQKTVSQVFEKLGFTIQPIGRMVKRVNPEVGVIFE